MKNITSNYDALQAAAEKATKGNWINVGAWVENERDDLKDICDCRPNGNEDYDQALRDATYIALANPDTILRLLFERRTLEWISVSDRLPPADVWVLAHNGRWTGVAMYTSTAEFVDESWQDERHEFIELLGPAVTHWTPLPAAPSGAQAKHPASASPSMHAVRDMLAERRRQVLHEGMTPDQDDGYTEAELPRAAAAYVLSACGFSNAITLDFWPWSTDWWKPTTPRSNLVKAAALIIAEIERIDRDPGDESHHDHVNGGSL
ncbi:DUF551 domain-containing protein [Burkholderia contaminans]|uniref:DUF551 domain-containing protein n=1 Tax=Burkholderia contaminans TaxID=488447 RepID=UPI001CF370DC|nr:DUF551 domain-containing protein [Burkholderia contaminans]MCA7914594.1 DUF551 domain-containing protein [Burkholderia contaminans]UUX36412.1 DUF551 domain-containing protein [Burkholderia contaminans]